MRKTQVVESRRDQVQPVYLLIDASGSTTHSGFNNAYNQALPDLISSMEQATTAAFHLSIVTFGAQPSLILALTDAHTLQFMPQVTAGGFSSLAAGLRLLGRVMFQDAEQSNADGLLRRPALVAILTDGQPTDSTDDVRSAYQDCCAQAGGLVAEVLVVLAGEDVAASVAGLGQGLMTPDVDVVELPVIDAEVVSMVVGGWLTRERAST